MHKLAGFFFCWNGCIVFISNWWGLVRLMDCFHRYIYNTDIVLVVTVYIYVFVCWLVKLSLKRDCRHFVGICLLVFAIVWEYYLEYDLYLICCFILIGKYRLIKLDLMFAIDTHLLRFFPTYNKSATDDFEII